MAEIVQVWNSYDWEVFTLGLLQSRHGALSVHKIPAAHKGDFGIDYYCPADGVAYQCYAVEEPIDISTRAQRQKKKITIDLGKLVKNFKEVSDLFLGSVVKHWFLLVPLHDSKDVNLHCANKTIEIRKQKHNHLCPLFEVMVQDQTSFPPHLVSSYIAGLNELKLNVPTPTDDEMSKWQVGSANLLANANKKLAKRTTPEKLSDAVADAIQFSLRSAATLDALRSSAPELHEKIIGAIASRYRLLNFAGPEDASSASQILHTQIKSLVAAIKDAAPNLSEENADQIAYGSICDWIMNCSLDFPANAAG